MAKWVWRGDDPDLSFRMTAAPPFCAGRALASRTIAHLLEAFGRRMSAVLHTDRAEGMPAITVIAFSTLKSKVDAAVMLPTDGNTIISDGVRLCQA